jgi:hypothetical protein
VHVGSALSSRHALADEIERREPRQYARWLYPILLVQGPTDQIDVLVLYLGLGKEGLNVAAKTSDQPNILVIFGDDIGLWNRSIYNCGAHEVGVGARNS